MEGPKKNPRWFLELKLLIKKIPKRSELDKQLTSRITYKTNFCAQSLYLRGQDGWRHLIAKVGLGRDLGMGATSALCYAAATHHRVYILSREGKDKVALFI